MLAPIVDVAIDPLVERVLLVGRSAHDVEATQELGFWYAGRPHDVHRADMRSGGRIDVEHEAGPVRRVLKVVARVHGGVKIPARAERVLHDAFDLERASERRRQPEMVDDRAAKLSSIHARHAERAAEEDFGDGVHRNEVVSQRHTGRHEGGVDVDLLEPAQAEEMGDGLPHLRHQERRSDLGDDNLGQRRVRGLAALDHQTDGRHRLAKVAIDLCLRRRRRAHEQQRNNQDRHHSALANQNTCLTRNSSA